ncbi:recombinase family protein (plasmid) [Streptomyces sp. L7]
MNIVGYARVSTREQNPDAQEAELREAGAGRVFVDRGESSRVADRPQWVACLDFLREGDTLVIRALDRIAGSELMAIELIRDLGRRGIRLRSLTEPFLDVDTSTPMGRPSSASWPF